MRIMIAPIDDGDQRLMISHGHEWGTQEVEFGLFAGPLKCQEFQFAHGIVEFGL